LQGRTTQPELEQATRNREQGTRNGTGPGKVFHEKGRGNGYLLTVGDKRIYLSGDTACTDEMRGLAHIDVALVCMNLPYTMPPEEAADCVKTFKPKVVIPFHYRGSDTQVFAKALEGVEGVEVRLRDFYRKP
jgi:L-ascorbate metabolism protein UlaG (beta-lactamase superfamily)